MSAQVDNRLRNERLEAAERAVSAAEAALMLNLDIETRWRYLAACAELKKIENESKPEDRANSAVH